MKKIPTIYLRDPKHRAHVTDEINPECQWVFDGEGVATRKFDGTCVMKDETGMWWARREVKHGKPFPYNFIGVDQDLVTGKWQGWIPIGDSPFYKFWEEAIVNSYGDDLDPGTYELIGPKINGNPENLSVHFLQSHKHAETLAWGGVEPSWLIDRCRDLGYEGIVWHHPDGRMAKLKVRDFK